ncbi:Uu.00g022080.m01.CDS01 [Anthostomella pinea]|uniref:Uu.00g022080.m01.CDS01 n=1 Tax=Anthostomella pinea TaxID=933095 RepID=A0AAI8YQU5_9PEZI|nr:Uu.00g022080.m01.CDS01 [Anthostomella pinea]
MADVEALCNELSEQVKALRGGSEAARRRATAAARRIITEISDPEEMIEQQSIVLAEMACIRMYIAWGFFDKIPAEGSVSYAELASSINASESLVRRMGQMLVATGMLKRPQPDHVALSRLAPTFKTDTFDGCHFTMMTDEFQPAYQAFPGFFEKYGAQVPEGETKVPFCFPDGVDGKLTYWELIAKRGEGNVDRFGRAMQGLQTHAWPYTGIYDFSWIAEYAQTNSERPLLLDIGGGQGQMIRAVLEETPAIPRNRCYLQDRPEVIGPVKESSANDPVMKDVQKLVVNFHKEQPVKGMYTKNKIRYACALVYLIRRCIHDYTDEDSVKVLTILANALPADEPRARVLINDQINTEDPTPFVAAYDLLMLTIASMERSEKQFADLAARAGLEVVKVHMKEGTMCGVVECKKAGV